MKFTLTSRKFALTLPVALSVAAASTIGLFAEARPSQKETERATVENETFFPGNVPLQPATLSWREILKRRPASVCRVRFQIESTATSVDEQLLLAGGNCGFAAIILEPSQPSENESRERFEVAIVGDARSAVERLGLSSSDFRDQWIEVTGFPRHFSERRADGDVAVSQFVVSEIESLEIHSSNWNGSAF